jgi:hypothetical protein
MSTEETELAVNEETKHLGLALAVISAAQLMLVLDATIVNVAIPTIHHACISRRPTWSGSSPPTR